MKTSRHKVYDLKTPIFIDWLNVVRIPIFDEDKVVAWARVDREDADVVLQHRYHLSKGDKRYVYTSTLSLQELIMGFGAPEGYVIDHINGDTLDNTRGNLRYATHSENSQNKPKMHRETNTSKYKGVTRLPNGSYQATLQKDYKIVFQKQFKSEELAAKEYDTYALYFYGAHARTNKLLTPDQIEMILNDGPIPEEYIPGTRFRNLPANIHEHMGQFVVKMTVDTVYYTGQFDTLEEAERYKTQVLLNIERERRRIPAPHIKRNADDVPIIELNHKGLVYEVLVDDETWHYLSKFGWSYGKGYARSSNANYENLMHRELWVKYRGVITPGFTVDHINNNKLDNRLANLRLATPRLQSHNREKKPDEFNRYRGVKVNSKTFTTFVDGKSYGNFKTAEEAAEKANEIYTKLYGKAARLNVIDWSTRTTWDNRIPLSSINRQLIKDLKTIKDALTVMATMGMKVGPKHSVQHEDITIAKLPELKVLMLRFWASRE